MAGTADDPRRAVPRTDALLAAPALHAATARLGTASVKAAIHAAQERVRAGELEPAHVVDAVLASLPPRSSSLRRVLNASGVLLHTNLGRAPLSAAAIDAVVAASGATDIELDLASGQRARRGRGALAALRRAVSLGSEHDVHVVNNGAAALLLAATALAQGRGIVVSRGELVEIGDGFRIPELLESTGARLCEVGTTNRTTLADYAAAVDERTAFVLKVHPSNFVVSGFTAAVATRELAGLPVPVVVDIGSGLLTPDPVLPDEPDAATALRDGAALVTASGDKLLGGPQAGLLFGRAQVIDALRSHPIARALRVDKLTLAALEATVAGPSTPTYEALHADPRELRTRADAIVRQLKDAGVDAVAVDTDAVVGGGGAPGVILPSVAVALPAEHAQRLRLGDPAVLGRVERGRLLLDLRAIAPSDDRTLCHAVLCAGR